MERRFLKAQDVAKILGVSRAKAYEIIKEMNQELQEKGFIVFAGRIPERYFYERTYSVTVGDCLWQAGKN